METQNQSEQPSGNSEESEKFVDIDRYQDIVISELDYFEGLKRDSRARGNNMADPFVEEKFNYYADINDILLGYRDEDDTVEEWLAIMRGDLARRKEKPADKQRQVDKDRIRCLEKTIAFVEADMTDPSSNDRILKDYREEQAKKRKEKLDEMREKSEEDAEEQIEKVKDELETGTEEGQEKELIEDILKNCGVRYHTSMDEGGHHGFHDRFDGRYLATDPQDPTRCNIVRRFTSIIGSQYTPNQTTSSFYSEHKNCFGANADRVLASVGITEMLYLEPAEKTLYESQTRQVEEETSGFMGFGKKKTIVPKTEEVAVGSCAVPMKELIKDGSDDEAGCRLFYSTTSDGSGVISNAYKDYSNRSGQVFSLELLLPLSTAEEVIELVRKNPEFMHRLVDSIALKDLGISPSLWEQGEDNNDHPLRPPYEKWREITGGTSKMYIVEEGDIKDSLDRGLPDFDEKFVVEY